VRVGPVPSKLVITDVDGVRVGHWTDREARTGCTVVLFPEGTVASGEVRGGAPATREFALLEPSRMVERLDAVVLSGGSAFGLAAADGAMRWLERRGVGFATGAGPVPIVVGMSLFDLMVGDGSVRPGPEEGFLACESAAAGAVEVGAVGAGTGATVDKWRGAAHRRPGGLGTATVRSGDVVVSALLAVNAFGDASEGSEDDVDSLPPTEARADAFGNTTLGVIATNARLDKTGCHLVAQGGHDGLARALFPPHTRVDGDAVVAATVGTTEAALDRVRAMAVLAVERAVRRACRPPA
jgi:L-aminopeptidase/D-esterase-like protein